MPQSSKFNFDGNCPEIMFSIRVNGFLYTEVVSASNVGSKFTVVTMTSSCGYWDSGFPDAVGRCALDHHLTEAWHLSSNNFLLWWFSHTVRRVWWVQGHLVKLELQERASSHSVKHGRFSVVIFYQGQPCTTADTFGLKWRRSIYLPGYVVITVLISRWLQYDKEKFNLAHLINIILNL